MKKTAFLAAISSAVCLLLTACSGGQTSDSAPDPSAGGTGTTTAPTTAPSRDDSAVIDRLGVDYRAHWKQYLMEFDNDSCDYWFIREGDTYHAYFLEFDTSDGGTRQHIAHATSTDFLNWKYQGVVLYGWGDTWDNRNLATGSVAKCGDTYYMLYTGHSTGRGGLGLAKSSDLYTWERVGDGPVISSTVKYTVPYEGTDHLCQVLADPYLYPEAIDGWYYAYVNGWAVDMPKNSRGAQIMFRTQDFVTWEPYRIACLADDLDRLETAQVWEHGGRWYMSFGGRSVDPNGGDFDDVASANYIYMADRFDGPYLKQDWSKISYINASGYYIQKQMLDPVGDEVMLPMAPYRGVLWPYYIRYGADGAVSFDVIFG